MYECRVFTCFVCWGCCFLFVCPASVHAKENAAIGYDDHTYAVLPVLVVLYRVYTGNCIPFRFPYYVADVNCGNATRICCAVLPKIWN